MKNPLMALLFLLSFTCSVIAGDIVLKEGECWSYATRPGEEASFLVIRKVETRPNDGEVVHISIFGLKIKHAASPNGVLDHIDLLSMAGASLRSSLKGKIEKPVPDVDWTSKYQAWLTAEDAGKGGVFTQPVSECVGLFDKALQYVTASPSK
jgi:hypothetical protein